MWWYNTQMGMVMQVMQASILLCLYQVYRVLNVAMYVMLWCDVPYLWRKAMKPNNGSERGCWGCCNRDDVINVRCELDPAMCPVDGSGSSSPRISIHYHTSASPTNCCSFPYCCCQHSPHPFTVLLFSKTLVWKSNLQIAREPQHSGIVPGPPSTPLHIDSLS